MITQSIRIKFSPRLSRLRRTFFQISLACCKIYFVFISSMIEVFNVHLDFFSRYASLYFCAAIEQTDNELVTLEVIHRYVELLDKYFGSVSAFDFNLVLTLYLYLPLFIFFHIGLWIRHNFQFWKSLLYAWWASAWWWNTRNFQEECVESHRSSRPPARGNFLFLLL